MTGVQLPADENAPDRCRVFVRMWQILVLLRCQPHTLSELARKLGVCTRTIRRDLKALQRVPLPIQSRFPDEGCRRNIRAADPQLWFVGELPAWPRREVLPIADVGASKLPPFPQGPLIPPGALS